MISFSDIEPRRLRGEEYSDQYWYGPNPLYRERNPISNGTQDLAQRNQSTYPQLSVLESRPLERVNSPVPSIFSDGHAPKYTSGYKLADEPTGINPASRNSAECTISRNDARGKPMTNGNRCHICRIGNCEGLKDAPTNTLEYFTSEQDCKALCKKRNEYEAYQSSQSRDDGPTECPSTKAPRIM